MRAWRAALLACATFMLAATSAQYINRPFRFDEAEFALIVRDGILRHGVPAIPAAERRVLPIKPAVEPAEPHLGMWHPPLYMYALAAAAMVTPADNWGLRAVGLIALLASVALAWRIARRLLPGVPRTAVALAAAAPLLSPLVIESALLIDIDGTVLMPLLLLFFERWLAWRDDLTPRRVALLSAIVAVSLTAKLTTPFIALAAAALHAMLDQGRVRRVGALVIAGAAGTAVFAAAYMTYCIATGYPAGFMFDLYGLRADEMGGGRKLADFALSLRWNTAWISPLLILLIVLHGGTRAWALIRRRESEPADLLWIFAAISAAAYIGVAAYWGKYMAPAVMAGVLGAGIWLARHCDGFVFRRPVLFAAAIAAAAVTSAMLVSPRANDGIVRSTIDAALRDPRNLALAVLLAMGVAIAIVAPRLLGARGRALAAGVALLTAAGATAVIEQSRVVFSRAENGPLRAGPGEGFDELMQRLNSLEGSPIILAPKEVGYYYRGRSYPLEYIAYHGDEAVARLGRREEVRVLVDTVLRPYIADPLAIADRNVEQIGTYRLYFKR
ncbi:MAG: glycosyltransferase family 39 protein [Acidobacteriota bacterium]|nr:glycosyltransferase family 39 protein [Acidobacteriota bacterium]